MTQEPELTRKNMTLELLKLSWPMLMVNLAYAMLGFTDTIFMSKLGMTQVGGVGVGAVVYFTGSLLLRSSINGVIPFVSRAYGAKEEKTCGPLLVNFLWLSVLAIPIVPVLYFFMRLALQYMITEREVLNVALTFVSIRIFELPIWLFSYALLNFRVGVGDSLTSLIAVWTMAILNVFLNYALVFGKFGLPALGVYGSGLATVLAIFIQLLLSTVLVLSKKNRSRFNIHFSFPNWKEIWNALRVGLPMGFMEFSEVAAFSTFTGIIARLGTHELAASQISNQIASLAFMPGFAISGAAGSLVGRMLGAQKPELANAVAYRAVYIGMVFMGLVGICFWFFGSSLAQIFNAKDDVLKLVINLLKLMAIYQSLDAMGIIFRGALTGAGDTRFPMVITLLSAWGIMIPGAIYLAHVLHWGLLGAWGGAFGFIVVMAGTMWWRFWLGKWKRIKLPQG